MHQSSSLYSLICFHFLPNKNINKLYPPLCETTCEISSFFPPLPPSPPILAGDKSIAIYDSFVAAARPLLPCLAVIRADSFRSVSLFKSCCNYTGFSICRRPDMIQSATTGESGAQRVNEKRDKAQWQEDQESKSERE